MSRTLVVAFVVCIVVFVVFKLVLGNLVSLSITTAEQGRPESSVPQSSQTSPEAWPELMATGKAPFLAQTRTFEPTATYVPNAPLQTDLPIEDVPQEGRPIFHMMGLVSFTAACASWGGLNNCAPVTYRRTRRHTASASMSIRCPRAPRSFSSRSVRLARAPIGHLVVVAD